MSSAKRNSPKRGPMFKLDPETGKHVPLPCKWLFPSEVSTAEKDKADGSKKELKIRPLKLTDLDLDDSPDRASKMRKTDSVRKGLFNVPSSKIGRPSIVRRSMTRRSMATKKNPQNKNKFELSPLLDMEEVEEELISKKRFLKGYPFRSPGKPSINFSKETKPSPLAKKTRLEKKNTPKKDTSKTPESTSSNDAEFLELEKECRVDEPEKENKSPISSVCNLLQGTVLSSAKKNKSGRNINNTNVHSTITDIETILDDTRKAFEQYTTNYEANLAKITELLESNRTNHDHLLRLEETNRRKISDIIADLKGDLPNKPKVIVSPAIMKSADLRRTALTRNLVAKTQQQIHSPRIRKALDMYNSMRHDISVLATPKLDRKSLMESPKSSNLSVLSRRVQSQCLLLQDTPLRKN